MEAKLPGGGDGSRHGKRLPSTNVSSQDRRWLLSGGIGSGKSEVRRLLEAHGIRTVDADSIGHAVLQDEALPAVSRRWPDVMVEGVVDRSRLAGVVFARPDELAALEAITHPLILGRIEAELEGFEGIAVVEAPVIDFGATWPRMVVDAPDDIRLGRAVARGMSRDDVQRRMDAQPSRGEWLAAADVVVPNYESLGELGDTVARLSSYIAGHG
jgi:dephospho-CoA kinase